MNLFVFVLSDVNSDFWDNFADTSVTSQSTKYGSQSAPLLEFDQITKPSKDVAPKTKDSEWDLEAWLNDDSSTELKVANSKTSQSVTANQNVERQDSWGGNWDDSGWEEVDGFSQTNDDKSSKCD